jgi:ribose-phosphate pyrophosphokinase
MKIFSGSANNPLAEKIARALHLQLSPLEIFVFPDQEKRIRIEVPVVDEETIIVQPTSTPADSNYMELFFIADALQRSGAKSITAIIPYLGYERQDHVFRDGEAVSLEVIVKTLQAVGIDKVVTVDLHSIKIPEVFQIPVSHVSALRLFAEIIKKNNWFEESVLISPDMGGIRRIKLLSEMLGNLPYAVVEKDRDLASGSVEAVSVEGTLAKRALLVDDMIASGSTMVKAAELLQQKGVEHFIAFGTHAVFSKEAPELLNNSLLEKVYVTDTVWIPDEKKFQKLEVLTVADLLARELF